MESRQPLILDDVLRSLPGAYPKWILRAGPAEEEFGTFLAAYDSAGSVVSESGFMGPKLYPGRLINTWDGQTDKGPHFVIARSSPRITRIVVTVDGGISLDLDMSLPFEGFDMRFAVGVFPSDSWVSSVSGHDETGCIEEQFYNRPPWRTSG